MTSTIKNPMKSLYKRLRLLGIDKPYVQKVILPEWWDDDAAESAAGYQEALILISRHLGVSLKSLQDETALVEIRDLGTCNFKKSRHISADELPLARAICTRAAILAVSCTNNEYTLPMPSGSDIRDSILESGTPWVSLDALLDWCWSAGIPVLHVSHFPRNTKKMDGMAAIVDGRPVIVLCKNAQQEAWLLFILAHELGHIIRGHVLNNGVLVDEQVSDSKSDDTQEDEANETALEILTGKPKCRFMTNLGRYPRSKDLAQLAQSYGEQNQVDPGHVVLNYCNYQGATFHALGSAALNVICTNPQAPQLIYEKMVENLDWSNIPEDSSEFLMRVTSPKPK